MEDSFQVRVDKAFGSLESSTSASLWCLTDEEIARNEWIHDKLTSHKDDEVKNPKPNSSFLKGLVAHQDLESDIQELDDEQQPMDDHNNDEWNNIRCSVGMDCTLDNEEEEDGFDKVASGIEECERFYVTEVNDYEVEIDSNIELPSSLTNVIGDPQADHIAAKLRLKEDEESANLQGLLPEIQENIIVPGYIQNPSKYTHYTFDSIDDVDEESNKKAYMDLFNSLKLKGMDTQDNDNNDSPKSIIFIPKNKSLKKTNKVEEYTQKKVVPISISEIEEVSAMEEDEIETSRLQKGGRKYRAKVSDDVE